MANEAKIQSAQDALSNGLVDGLIYDDQLKKMIAKKLKGIKENDIPFVSVKEYAKSVPLRGTGAGKIAVVYADGDIVMGKGVKGSIASDDFRMLLQKIRADESIDALVLRVNSPGGSALASDIIWREIELIKGKIPVVVSMGDVAASGGYYIASGADSIYADANTITGSIGVFTVIPNISGFMNNKLGISFDGVKTAPYADAPTVTRPLNTMEQKMLQKVDIALATSAHLTRKLSTKKTFVKHLPNAADTSVFNNSYLKKLTFLKFLFYNLLFFL